MVVDKFREARPLSHKNTTLSSIKTNNKMKFSVASFALIASANAFSFVPRANVASTALFAERINTKIDLDSPKVATMDSIEAGKKKVYCRCWQSGTFPLCDG